MSRKANWVTLSALIILSLGVQVGYAITLLKEEKALKKVFGKGCKTVREIKVLEKDTLKKVKARLNGSLVHHKKRSRSRSKSANVEKKTAIEFIFAIKDGKKTAVAIIDAQPGKWGPVKFIIALDLEGSVTRVEVMSYKEKRGRPIARRSFLRQFERKTGKDALKVRKDIVGISGATISSKAAAFAVKKAIVLYEELYDKTDKQQAEDGSKTDEPQPKT